VKRRSRLGRTAALGIAALAALGWGIQAVAERADLRRHRAPGRLVDLGGRKLHLVCAGTGPSVVIEAGSGDDSTLWDDVVRHVSAFARVCAYDRAGLGWSDPAPGPRTIDDRATELRAMLQAAGLPAPYVLVGHSYGGLVVRRFAALFPRDVAGLVLIDAVEEAFVFAPEGLRDAQAILRRARRRGWLVRFGVLRLGIALFPSRVDPLRGVPAAVHGMMTALHLRASRHFAQADEMRSYERVPPPWRQAGGMGELGDLPLAVVSRAPATSSPAWDAAQCRLAALSRNSTHAVAEHAGHVMQFSEPAIIIAAVRRVLAR
jgi:pimeloyl-ACP methyl ester carboxylesterase